MGSPAVTVTHDDGDSAPTTVAQLTSSVDMGHGLLKQCSDGDITISGFRVTNGGADFTADSVVTVTVSHAGQVPETLCPSEADPAATCGYTAPSVVATGEAVVDAETGTITGITLKCRRWLPGTACCVPSSAGGDHYGHRQHRNGGHHHCRGDLRVAVILVCCRCC